MIILIGGSSHVGKTLISQKLIEKFHYPCTSLDHLKMGFIRTGRTELTVEDDYKMRFWLWPFAAEMIKTAIENKQNMIIEGCYIPRQWKESFTPEYLKEIRAVFIVMSERYLRTHSEDISRYASVIENRIDDEVNIERLIDCSKSFKEDCIANGTPFVEIDDEYNLDKILEAFC
ncbi:MAG: adenylate kinase [Treponemataceae bacterium]|nr:adenylate kinase [Treponemataceae bacterium]